MSSQPTDPNSHPQPQAQKRLVAGVIIALVGVGVVVAIIWAVNKRASKSGQTIVLLPLVNKGVAQVVQETRAPVLDTPTPVSSPAAQVLLPTVETPSLTSALPSPTTTTQPAQNPTQTNRPEATTAGAPSPTRRATSTQGTTPQVGNTATTTPTTVGSSATVIFRNDQACVDSRLSLLYIFGEIVNDSSQAYDIKGINVKVYDYAGEIPTGSVSMDTPIPSNFFIFANSSIPFVLYARIARPQPTHYELSLETQPGQHTPRTDLRVDDYTSVAIQDLIQISGKWSYTNLAAPPDYVSIYVVAYDALGRVANLGSLQPADYQVPDPALAPGQHSFDFLTLEKSPCGGGNLVVKVLGE